MTESIQDPDTQRWHVPSPIPAPAKIQEDDFLALPEIMFLARDADGKPFTRARVEQWKSRGSFIPEDDAIGYQPVWRLGRVLAFLDAKGYTYDVKAWRKRRDAGGFRR